MIDVIVDRRELKDDDRAPARFGAGRPPRRRADEPPSPRTDRELTTDPIDSSSASNAGHEVRPREHLALLTAPRSAIPSARSRPVHRRGHQRQGVGDRDGRTALRDAGVPRGALHLATPGAARRALRLDGEPVDTGASSPRRPCATRDEAGARGHARAPPTFFDVRRRPRSSCSARAASTSRSSRSGSAGGSTRPTSSIPRRRDHVDRLRSRALLGTTLERIAFEKAGIIKPGVPVVVRRSCRAGGTAVVAGRCGARARIACAP